MDRRQQKTRLAILTAFTDLLAVKSYGRITVQEIIDAANVGRTTFYSHFETKEALLDTLCDALFGHIINDALNQEHTHGLYPDQEQEVSIFFHVLAHLQENDHNILKLLSGESSTLFMPYFRNGMKNVIEVRLHNRKARVDLPEEFLVNHIAGSFIELVYWWIEGGMKYTPRELDGYFRLVTEPLLEHKQASRD
ncbi:MAG: TetR/AcrR family transcriptional regulator [Blautia sp.]|nr:TetR/AcrR family transcriptional regulator [Blautia sp.]